MALKCPQCGGSLPPGAEGYALCQYCGSSLVFGQRAAQAGTTGEAVVRGIRLRWLPHTDTQGTGLELFRMLVPIGCELRGGSRWWLDNPQCLGQQPGGVYRD